MGQSAESASSRSKPGAVYVALLRGINVGGKNKLPMANWAAMLVESGCSNVRTYIQSGNAVFSAAPATAKRLAEIITRQIADRFGLKVPVVLRTADEIRRVAGGNPFFKSGADADALHVAFLSDLPDPARIAALDPNRSPGDSFHVRGREVYLHLPNGVAKSKLTNAYFDSKLATISTARNWRTVLKLVEMTQTTV